MGNAFVHIELNTDNLAGAQKFYSKLFDWKVKAMPDMPTYLGITTGAKATGGGMQVKPMADGPTSWLPYVEVADVKKSIAQAKKLGATIAVPYQPIGDMGAIGVFIDPTGAALGVWAPMKAAKKKAKSKPKPKAKRA